MQWKRLLPARGFSSGIAPLSLPFASTLFQSPENNSQKGHEHASR